MSTQGLKGIGVSRGIAIGKALLISKKAGAVNRRQICDVSTELDTLHRAIAESRSQLMDIYEKGKAQMGKDAEIILVQEAFLDDEALLERIGSLIKNEKFCADYAVQEGCAYYEKLISALDDAYLKERVSDLRDIAQRIIGNIQNDDNNKAMTLNDRRIIVAEDMTPSQTMQLDKDKILGFVTEKGGATSHVAILAKAMGIPAVVGVQDIYNSTENGQTIAMDGATGEIFVSPDSETIERLNVKKEKEDKEAEDLKKNIGKRSVTKDGKRIHIYANIGSSEEVAGVLDKGGEGIGLFRTELLYIDRDTLPTEDEQYEEYKRVLQSMGDKPVIVRTVDIGGDKNVPYLNLPSEDNPFLGCRGIRLCLKEVGLFKVQLRALLRASIYGQLSIMFPMIATLSELSKAKAILEEAKEELTSEQIRFSNNIKVGIMIETPSAVILSDQLAKEVDFFSIGTNDLVQYTMAADRTNSHVAYLNDYREPAILTMIHQTIRNGHKHGIWVGICGEMAGDMEMIPCLVGMGVDELSMSSGSIPYAKEVINHLDFKKMRDKI